MFSDTRVFLPAIILALLSCGPFVAASSKAEENDAALKSRFDLLSQHGNVDCSAQFERLIGTMPQDGRLKGSCCAPMDEARYRQQIDGLKKYSDIAEVPSDPYDIRHPWRISSLATTTFPLTRRSRLHTTMRWNTPIWRVRAAASAGAGRYMAASVSS
jgi:hypothetical protein